MKNKKLLTLFLSGVLLLSGCSEGTAVTSSVSSIPSEAPASPGSVSANQPSSSSRLEDKLVSGGVYQVENWSLSDSPQAVGISLEEMDPIVEENDYKNMDHLLLVTMQYTAAPNIDGELLSTFLANNFSPMTESNLSAMEELMKKHPDSQVHCAPLPDPKGTQPNLLIKLPRDCKPVGDKTGTVYFPLKK